MSTRFFVAALGLGIATSSLTSPAAHAELPKTLNAGDAKLVLNGSGSRNKYFMKMYVVGLYLSKPSADGGAIVAANAPMAMRLEITSGMVTQERLVESLNEGFEKSTHGKPDEVRREIEQFRGLFAKAIAKGDVFDLTYLPSQGVVVSKNGKRQGIVQGLSFKKALFGIWLSEDPVDKGLKSRLLPEQEKKADDATSK